VVKCCCRNILPRNAERAAIIEYDDEDRLFVGRVINTKDLILFDGISVEELEQSFHNVIDEYLEDCQTLNKTPDLPFSGELNLSISPNIHKKVAIEAQKKGVSLNSFIEEILINNLS